MILVGLIVVACWLIGNLFTRVWQDYFIFRFTKLPDGAPLHFEHPHLEVRLEGAKGGRLHAVFFQQANAKGIVLFFHGNRGHVGRWGHVAHTFIKRGYDVLVPDYRGYGRSSGERSEALFYEDADRWYQWVLQRYPGNRISLYGRSLGSAPATYLASRHACAQLLLETPFASMRNLFYTYYPFLPPVFFFKYTFENEVAIQDVACPIVVFAGLRDFVVPFRCTKRLLPKLKPSDQVVIIKEGGHNNLASFAEYHTALERALD
jgi:fermentation-respiration switch protein FrsA (DUF1100 family)